MIHRSLALMLTLGILAWADAALAEDEPQGRAPADDLDVTMRVIEDPDAVNPEAITRRITLPEPPAPRGEAGRAVSPQDTPADGSEVSEMAREKGRESGEEIAEQAREQAEQAKEKREERGRSRAEEMRPDPPKPPRPDPPVPPRS